MKGNADWFTFGPVSPIEVANISRRVNLDALNGKRILITGAQGLIGNYLAQATVEAMLAQGLSPSQMFLQSRRKLDHRQAWTSQFKFVEHLHFSLDFLEVFPAVDVIVHAASPASPSKYNSPETLYIPNISGIVTALALSPVPERQLFISSGEVYGLHAESIRSSEINPRFQSSGPRADYPNAKLVAEKLFLASRFSGSRFNVARLFHTFGPGLSENDGRSFADFLHAAAKHETLTLYSKGDDVRNFAYIEDSVAGLLEILVSEGDGQVFDVAGPTRLTIREFAEIVAHLSGADIVIEDTAAQRGRTPVIGYPPIPSTQALTALGWSAGISLVEGARRTLEFIQATLGSQQSG
jgi:nucleoside-diphosphate-sugar epimerase